MDPFKKVFLAFFLIILVGGGYSVFKYWRMLDDKGLMTNFFQKMMPNLVTPPKDESIKDANKPRGGDIEAVVKAHRAEIAREEEARRTGKPVRPVVVKPINTPGPDDRVITEWFTARKMVALTYDDGPHKEFTPKLLQTLKDKNARATFFVQGVNIAGNEDILRDAYLAGHEISNHSWSHKQLTRLGTRDMTDEIMKCSNAVEAVTGKKPRLVRPPYGAHNQQLRDNAKTLDIYLINWSIDTNDWRTKSTTETIVAEVEKMAYDGCIILMHDRLQRTIDATGPVIDLLRAKGYRCVTVSQLLGFDDPDAPLPAIITPAPALVPIPPSGGETSATVAEPTPPPAPTPSALNLPLPQAPNIEQTTETEQPPNFDSAIPDLPKEAITLPKPVRF